MGAKKETKKVDEHVQIVTSGSNIRFEPVKSSRQPKHKQNIVVNIGQDIRPIGNFLDFIRDHAVVSLIIGFVLGSQVQTMVKQLVQSFIDPLTQLLFGKAISTRTFILHLNGRYAPIGWGAMVYTFVIFIFVLITLYMVIRFLRLDKLELKKKKETP